VSAANTANQRIVVTEGPHTEEVLRILAPEIKAPESLRSIKEKAAEIIRQSVDPLAGPPPQPSDGLLYGLIQSGKTSIITVAAAMAADNGFQCIVILTSDIDLLYDQTLERIRKALRGLSVLGKNDWRDPARFERHLRTPPFVVVCSKNGSKLNSLLDAFQNAKAKKLSTLIIDDEADQASLNTFTSKASSQISKINEVITNIRNYFPVNTYLQVTATPQALFLQRPNHRYRPSFTVLSDPGPGYVGGESFFGENSNRLLREVPLGEVNQLLTTLQPSPAGTLPAGLRKALLAFLVGATSRFIQIDNPSQGCAFLCHVSVSNKDHKHIVNLIDRFKEDTLNALADRSARKYELLMKDLQQAYDDIVKTDPGLAEFKLIIQKIKFYLNGASVKLINATSKEEIQLDSVYNILVGGNKLGRGVTISNLLVSYYGRNPKRPNADTVLQHARMYGYREKDLGVTRLFLPDKLAEHFKSIHELESGLRGLLANSGDGSFEGIYVTAPLLPTRGNVLDPNSIGYYVAGSSYNPAYPLRTPEIKKNTDWIDSKLTKYNDQAPGQEVTIDFVLELLQKCKADPRFGIELWNAKAIEAALATIKSMARYGNKAYIVVRRGRALNQPRRETQWIITKGEEDLAPKDAPTLFIYRQNANAKGEIEVWWPQLRFPDGNYALAFSFDW
jgi:hypothetical protein